MKERTIKIIVGIFVSAMIIGMLIFNSQDTYYAVHDGPEHRLYMSYSFTSQKGYAKLIKQIEKDGYNPEQFKFKKR